jgi:hypothetical protein
MLLPLFEQIAAVQHGFPNFDEARASAGSSPFPEHAKRHGAALPFYNCFEREILGHSRYFFGWRVCCEFW